MCTRFGLLNAILTYFIFLYNPGVSGQSPEILNKYNLGLSVMKGFIVPHSPDVHHLMYGRPIGLEVSLSSQTDGRQAWQKRYNLPETGISITYFDTNMKPTGSLWYALAYMKFHLIRQPRGGMTLRVGTGLTYSAKPYDKEKNNLNNMISSILTYNMQGRLGWLFRVHDTWYVQPHITLSHASNGSVKLPNAGINILSGGVSVGYGFNTTEPVLDDLSNSTPLKRIHYNLLVSGAPKEITPPEGKKYGFYTIRSYIDLSLNHSNRLIGGLDIFFNRSLQEQIRRKENVPDDTDYKRVGLIAGHELAVGNVSVMVQAGYYVYRPFRADDDPDFYQRYGLKYYFLKRYFATTMLKTHGGRADNFDFGIGMRL